MGSPTTIDNVIDGHQQLHVIGMALTNDCKIGDGIKATTMPVCATTNTNNFKGTTYLDRRVRFVEL